jgi:DOMON domain
LELAVAVRATGWLGFGISENGGMLGSDMIIFETLDPTVIKDAHVKDYCYPETDACQSWELIRASSNSTKFLIVEMRRALDTLDSQDWVITNDANVDLSPRRVIAAWGDESFMSYHGARNARSS